MNGENSGTHGVDPLRRRASVGAKGAKQSATVPQRSAMGPDHVSAEAAREQEWAEARRVFP
jgi:hypothetical protein